MNTQACGAFNHWVNFQQESCLCRGNSLQFSAKRENNKNGTHSVHGCGAQKHWWQWRETRRQLSAAFAMSLIFGH
jgi:hypothetical protein